MKLRPMSPETDRLVALVGGGGLVLSAVPTVVWPFTSGMMMLWGPATRWSPLLFAAGLIVLAFGLPGHAGVFGSGRLVRTMIAVSSGLTLASMVGGRFVPLDEGRIGSTESTVTIWVFTVIGAVAVLALLVAAVAARAADVSSSARLGLRVLVGATVVAAALPYLYFVLVDRGAVTHGSGGVWLLGPLVGLVTVAAGVWFAWPWLAPHVAVARVSVRRAWQRYVDSTP